MFLYVHHVHYVVDNRDEMVAYLAANFGMKPSYLGGNDNGKEARYQVGKTEIQIVETNPGCSQGRHFQRHGPGVYHVAWAVDDIESIKHNLKANGNKLLHGRPETQHEYRTCTIDPASSNGLRLQLVENVE